MAIVTTADFIDRVLEIYSEQPEYKLGHDGSDGYCDCIGMVKGAIRRAGGVGNGLSGTNFAARNTIEKLRKIQSASYLQVGDVVLKGRQPGESGYDLPDRYKTGTDLTDYYHIGTVTNVNPLEITHMTAPTAKKDTKLGKWNYVGWIPEVKQESPSPEPEPDPPEPTPVETTAIVDSPNGKPVNMRTSPSLSAALIDKVPVGEIVTVLQEQGDWCRIKWKWKVGWMMSKFLVFEQPVGDYSITINGLTKEEAEQLHEQYPNSIVGVG